MTNNLKPYYYGSEPIRACSRFLLEVDMTGMELVQWIIKNDAEDKQVWIETNDGNVTWVEEGDLSINDNLGLVIKDVILK